MQSSSGYSAARARRRRPLPDYDREKKRFVPPEREVYASPYPANFRVGYRGGIEANFIPYGRFGVEIVGTEGRASAWDNGQLFRTWRPAPAGRGVAIDAPGTERMYTPEVESAIVRTIRDIPGRLIPSPVTGRLRPTVEYIARSSRSSRACWWSDGVRRRAEMGDTKSAEQGRGRFFFGTQGWSYEQWQGWMYPPKTPAKDRLGYYARHFDVAEVDSTYYRLPSVDTVRSWAGQIPEGFVMTPKVPGEITIGRQPGPRRPAGSGATKEGPPEPMAGARALAMMEEFLRVLRMLGANLGPIVFQMSPSFSYPTHFNALATMLNALPSLGGEGLEFCVEFRNPSWLTKSEPEALLAAHDVAWVWNDWEPTERWAKPMPRAIDDERAAKVTSKRVHYLRLVGNHDADVDFRRVSIDRTGDLVKWADLALKFRRERESRGIYILLNNHYAGCSPESVRELQRIMGLPVVTFGDDPSGASKDEQDTGKDSGQLTLPLGRRC